MKKVREYFENVVRRAILKSEIDSSNTTESTRKLTTEDKLQSSIDNSSSLIRSLNQVESQTSIKRSISEAFSKQRNLEERLVSSKIRETGVGLKEKIKKIETSIQRLNLGKLKDDAKSFVYGFGFNIKNRAQAINQDRELYSTEKELIKKLNYYDKFNVFPEDCGQLPEEKELKESGIKNGESLKKSNRVLNIHQNKEIEKFLSQFKQEDAENSANVLLAEKSQFNKRLMNSLNSLDGLVSGKTKIENDDKQIRTLRKMENIKIENCQELKRKELESRLSNEKNKMSMLTLKINGIIKDYTEIKSELDAHLYLLTKLRVEEQKALNFNTKANEQVKGSLQSDLPSLSLTNRNANIIEKSTDSSPSRKKKAVVLKSAVEQQESQILLRQNLSFRISRMEEEIGILRKELNMKDYIRKSLRIDQLKLDNNVNLIKKELEEVKDLLYLHYHKILMVGTDSRTDGLVWIIKSIWLLNKDVLMSYIPKILDNNLVKYLFQVAHKEIELYHANELMKEIKEVIIFNRGVSLRNTSKVERFSPEEAEIKNKNLLAKIQMLKESYPIFSIHNNEKGIIQEINMAERQKKGKQQEPAIENIKEKRKRSSIKKNQAAFLNHSKSQSIDRFLDTEFTSRFEPKKRTESESITNVNLSNLHDEASSTVIHKTLEQQILKIEQEVNFDHKQNITKDNIVEFIEGKEFLDDDTKYLLDYVKMLENLRISIKLDLKVMKANEIRRISSEFYFNNYEKQFGATLEQIVEVIVGEENKDTYLKSIEAERKDYIEKIKMIRHLNPFGLKVK